MKLSSAAQHRRFRISGAAARVASFVCAAATAAANDHFGPTGNEFVVNAGLNYDQYWCRVDVRPDASLIGFAYTAGQDPQARQFHIDGTPATGTLICNPTLNVYIQDEPETCFSVDGRQLVAWSERNGYDGEIMGIFGRIFQPGGVPVGPEYQINEIWQASEWRPLIAAHPAGGWVVDWSGDWDGDARFRILNSDGTFRTNDIQINTFGNGAQVDPACAVASDGRMLHVFVDFSGHSGSGTGLNIWGRLFDANGNALQAVEYPMTSPAYSALDQREPRLIADPSGRFIMVWEDAAKDGNSWGIFGRVFDHDALPLGSEFQINTNTTGAQRNPRIAGDSLGNFVVCWEDWSSGDCDVHAQRFDSNQQKIGTELLVNQATVGDQKRPSVAMAAQTGHVVFCWEGPGTLSDTYARIYSTYAEPQSYCTAKVNSLGCTPAVAWTGQPTASGSDDFHVLASQVLNNRSGLLFWGFAGGALPFGGGTLCVQPPVVRTGTQLSGGNQGGDDCSGAYDVFFSQSYMVTRGLVPGTSVHAQFWSRDPGFPTPQNIGLTNALSFDIKP